MGNIEKYKLRFNVLFGISFTTLLIGLGVVSGGLFSLTNSNPSINWGFMGMGLVLSSIGFIFLFIYLIQIDKIMKVKDNEKEKDGIK